VIAIWEEFVATRAFWVEVNAQHVVRIMPMHQLRIIIDSCQQYEGGSSSRCRAEHRHSRRAAQSIAVQIAAYVFPYVFNVTEVRQGATYVNVCLFVDCIGYDTHRDIVSS
jgi:hypothetical protein